VLIAAALWVTLGVFYKGLIANYQMAPLSIVFYRAMIAALVLYIILGVWRRNELCLKKQDWGFFILFGFLGVTTFFYVYIITINVTGMGMAAVLLYTAPIWVMIFSALFLHEHFDWWKGISLLLAVLGTALVGKIYDLVRR
jgi:drug/metabolite transporter, DME family